MNQNRIDFFSEVKVSDNAKDLEIRGKKGVVMGISEENDVIYSYGVHIYGEMYIRRVGKNDLIETGKKFKREDFYDGSSIGVTPGGEITRVDIKPK